MKEILSAAQTAKVIGCSEQMVREKIKCGVWKFGKFISAKERKKRSNSYEVNKRALAKWLDMTVEEIDQKLERKDGVA